MKIIHALWSLGVGGTESMLVDIVNEQVKEHDVYIIVINNSISPHFFDMLDKKCKVYCCNRKIKSKSPIPIFKFNYLLWKIHADIIHIHMDNLGKFLWFTHGAKKVRTIHCAFGLGKDYKYYDKLFSISEGVREYTLNQGFDSTVVYNGIHPEQITYKEKMGQTSGIVKIVNVGRLKQVKGQQLLIEAAHKLILLGYDNFSIDFIGDGDNRNSLETMVKDYHLDSLISFLGMKSREYVYKNLCNYDLYVQPSLSEGFGLTLAEAMVAGVPVITSDQDGPMEVICKGKYGGYFETNNSESLTKALIEFFHNKSYEKVNFARTFVIQNFDIKVTADKYIKQYYKILNSTK